MQNRCSSLHTDGCTICIPSGYKPFDVLICQCILLHGNESDAVQLRLIAWPCVSLADSSTPPSSSINVVNTKISYNRNSREKHKFPHSVTAVNTSKNERYVTQAKIALLMYLRTF